MSQNWKKQRPKMGEERAAQLTTAIAKRVQAANPEEPIGILAGAAAVLLLGGYTDPKDQHVLHAAGRLRERLADQEPEEAPAELEQRELSAAQLAELERIEPIWIEALATIEASVPDGTYRLWIEPLTLCGRDGDRLQVSAPPGIRAWTERRYAHLLKEALERANPKVAGVKFVTWIPAHKCASVPPPNPPEQEEPPDE